MTGDHRWFAVAPDADRLVKLDVESGEESPLATSPGLFDSASVHWPDEKGVVVVRAQRWFWLDFATGRAHEFPPEVKSVGLSMNAKGPGRLRSCGFGPREWGVADPVSGRFLRIVPGGDTIPLSLHDGGLALVRRDGTFERYDASLVRVEVKRHEVNR